MIANDALKHLAFSLVLSVFGSNMIKNVWEYTVEALNVKIFWLFDPKCGFFRVKIKPM